MTTPVFDKPQWSLKHIDHPDMFGVVASTAEVYVQRKCYMVDVAPGSEMLTFLYQVKALKPDRTVIMFFVREENYWVYYMQTSGAPPLCLWRWTLRDAPAWLVNIEKLGRPS